VNVLEAVKRANRPGPPEGSVRLRILVAASAVIGILACRAEGELTLVMSVAAIALLLAGMVFSHRTRARPKVGVKPVLAVLAVVVFAWFFVQLRGHAFTDIGGVEGLLAGLFVWIQVTHAFDVPARRDLAFSLAGSAGLMAVAGAQATDLGFGVYAAAWGATCLAALFAMWQSASGGAPVARAGAGSVLAVTGIGVAALLLVPAPQVAGNIGFPSSLGAAVGVTNPSGFAGDGAHPSQPSRPGTPVGPSRVGGYLGFANHLDTALRGSLGDAVVMRVRAQRPTYWVGETFDTWDGQSWLVTSRVPQTVDTGSPFFLPVPEGSPVGGTGDLQTFYVVAPNPNLVFHAATAREVWFPANALFVAPDGTITSPVSLGPGTVYSVESATTAPTPEQLRAASGIDVGLTGAQQRRALQLSHPYPHVQALAEAVTANAPTTYDKVQALISWIGAHTHYSTDIPPLAAGTDTVDQFLFGNRVGFCEQISTAMAVMLRSLGIPAREAVGYVPGSYNPVTDLYEVRAKDAHAWVQVWFPTYGWQSFDPTAVVPAANPSPGRTLLHDAGHALARVGWVPIGLVLGAGVALVAGVRAWRRRPRSWAERVTRRMERAGARAGRARRPEETVREYAGALDAMAGDPSASWSSLAWLVEQAAYGGRAPEAEARRRALRLSRTLRVSRSRTPAPRRSPHRPRAGAGRP
jgi:transglutaminase-like putative cysteine protease